MQIYKTVMEEDIETLRNLEAQLAEVSESRKVINEYKNDGTFSYSIREYAVERQRKDLLSLIKPLKNFIEKDGDFYEGYPEIYRVGRNLVLRLEYRDYPYYMIGEMVNPKCGYKGRYLAGIARHLGATYWMGVTESVAAIIANGLKMVVKEIEEKDLRYQPKSSGNRLSKQQVEQIKSMLSNGYSGCDIADKIGINPSTVWSIKNEKTHI